jgi:hypothetical protein
MGIYEYNAKCEPEKRPYEHSNHSDETLVDSNHESIKPHEARSVSCIHLKRHADPPHRFMSSEDPPPFNTRLQSRGSSPNDPFSSIRLRHPLRHLLAAVTGQ